MKLKSILLGCLFFCALAYAQENNKIDLPELEDSSGALISPAQDKELGAAFFRELHAQLTINEDIEIQEYIQTLGHQLVNNSDNPNHPFYFFVVMDNTINAFAGPGGYIGINSGLFLTTEAESELTSVMAHEIAHITQRHLYRAFEAARQLSIPTAAATLAAILLGVANPAIGQAAIMAVQAGNAQSQINFTRDNEQEADRIGMQTLVAAHYDPRSMPTFFERLQQATRFYGQSTPEFLRTHPVTESRIADTRGRSEQYPYRQYPDSQTYLLIKAKLRVLTEKNPQQNLQYFRTYSHQGTKEQRQIAHYGMALSYLKLQQWNLAEQELRYLIKQDRQQPHYWNGLARVAVESKHYSQGLAIYQQALTLFPNNRSLKIDYIQSLLKAGEAQLAYELLQSLPTDLQQQPLYFELLSQTYADLKQMAQSHRYVAEYYYQIGQIQTAILQMRLALKERPLDFYLRAILEERLRIFIEENNERRKES